MNNYCVYIHTNMVNGKIYIGMTSNIERRWRNGGIEYKPKKITLDLFGTLFVNMVGNVLLMKSLMIT